MTSVGGCGNGVGVVGIAFSEVLAALHKHSLNILLISVGSNHRLDPCRPSHFIHTPRDLLHRCVIGTVHNFSASMQAKQSDFLAMDTTSVAALFQQTPFAQCSHKASVPAGGDTPPEPGSH